MIYLLANTCTLVGDVLIAWVVFNVHMHIVKHHKIDDYVLQSMKKERSITAAGITLVVLGYVLEIVARFIIGV